MFWESKDLRKEELIRARMTRHRLLLQKATEDLSKLYDKVHKQNEMRKNGSKT